MTIGAVGSTGEKARLPFATIEESGAAKAAFVSVEH